MVPAFFSKAMILFNCDYSEGAHADILRGGELRFSVADTPSETCFTSKSR